MDADQKKLIEDAVKSDYFDKTLDILVQKKAVEVLKRYKWIAAFAGFFILAINTFLGFQITDFYKSKLELERAAKDLMLESSYLQSKGLLKKEGAQLQSAFFTEIRGLYDLQFKTQKNSFNDLIEDANKASERYETLGDTMTAKTMSFESKFDSLSKITSQKIQEVEEAREKLQKTMWDIVRHSSTIFAYVERGGTEGDWDYHPKSFTLPYSSDKIELTFREVSTVDSANTDGEKLKYKVARVIVQVVDSSGIEYSPRGLYLTEHQTQDIPDTEHQITLQYVYTPPNIIGLNWRGVNIIPDFVVLALSLKNPDTFLKKVG